MRIVSSLVVLSVLSSFNAFAQSVQPSGDGAEIKVEPAHAWTNSQDLMYLGVARAGDRVVAVGEHGVILLSDDEGSTFRQAKSVPVSSALTSVTFVDALHGWASGQWGVILATSDGGETWETQRVDAGTDQPLFSIYFKDEKQGWAAGLWSLLLSTQDGGKTWATITLPAPKNSSHADRNLFKIFSDKDGTLYICAEQGAVLRSQDNGASWIYLDTGYKGSLWSGVADGDGNLYVAGLRGSLYRSLDHGQTWSPISSGATASITGLVSYKRDVFGVSLDGSLISGDAQIPAFSVKQRFDPSILTGLQINSSGKAVLTTKHGVRVAGESLN